MKHAHRTGLISRGGRPVLQYTTDGELIKKFDTICDAAKAVSCSETTIGQVCSGRKKTVKGFVWKFETEKEPFGTEEGEEWKTVVGMSKYKVSSHGRVYSTVTSRFLTASKRKDGYRRLHLTGSVYREKFRKQTAT